MEIRGPLGPVHLDAQRQRIVLAMLLLGAGRILPVERLIYAVWEQSPPPTAKSQIQICVSTLRRALTAAGLPDAIVTRAPGYAIHVSPYEFDLHQFQQLTAEARKASADGRLADAARIYRTALGLFHGEPLAGLTSQLVQAAAVQINEQMLSTVEACTDVELRLGRHHDLVGDLLRLTDSHPVREKLHGQLMVALYRSGRQAEALAVYRRVRETLAEQHGLEPGDALRRLEHAILTASPDLDLDEEMSAAGSVIPGQQIVPQMLPTDVTDFTGRGPLLDELCQVLSGPPADGTPTGVPVVAIAGRGGVGKTALALHLAHLARADFPDGQLFAHLHGTEARPPTQARILERFLRALGVPPASMPDDPEERAELYRNRLAGRRLLVVLDDVANEQHVASLLPGSASCAVILTSRLRQTGLPSVHQVDLEVLDEDTALQMLGTVVGHRRVEAEPEAAREIVNLCGRLPLAIRIAAARLAARPHWQIDQLRSRLTNSVSRLDELTHRGLAVRPSIAISYRSLPAGAQQLLRRLSMLEMPEFAAWVAAPILDDPDLSSTEDLLEMLVDVRLLDAGHSDGQTRYHFHDLIRVFAREQLVAERQPQQRRDALARAVGTWLYLVSEAHRRIYGGDYTILHGNAPQWALAKVATDRLLQRPMDWLESERSAIVTAIGQAAEAGLAELCWDLAMSSVTLFEAHSHFDDWRETHEVALAACRRSGARRGEAAMLYSLGSLNLLGDQHADAGSRLTEALAIFDELGDRHGQALTLRNLAYLDRLRGLPGAALERYGQALSGLREAGDVVGEAHTLGSIAQIRIDEGDYDGAQRMLQRALELAQTVGSRRVEAQLLFRLGESQRERLNFPEAAQSYETVLRLARDTGDAVGEAYALYGLGRVQANLGRHADARRILRAGLALAQQYGGPFLTAQIHVALAEQHEAADDTAPAIEHLRTATQLLERIGNHEWRALAARRLDEARRVGGTPSGVPAQPAPAGILADEAAGA